MTSSRAARPARVSPRALTRSTTASAAAAWRSIRSAARCSSRPSLTSAMIRAIRCRLPTSPGSTPAATTRSMPTAERSSQRAPGPLPRAPDRLPRAWAWPALSLLLIAGLGLRLWGLRQGLPYVFNIDEADHFVPHAVRMFEEGTLNPHYFANPPGFTYLLHFAFAIWYGGPAGVRHALVAHQAELYTLAR